jgi:hypothetical protein
VLSDAGIQKLEVTEMTITKLLPKDFQQELINHGFNLPRYGADGYWGAETADACVEWFESDIDLSVAVVPPAPPRDGIVPADWMPTCNMERIVIHWTAGSYNVGSTEKESYHIIVDGSGKLWRGDYSIKANVSTSDADGYAAHTKSCNTGSIGISAACMAGAIENPFDPGAYPLTKLQWGTLAQIAAELCNKYDIPVTPTTVLQHGEVQKNLGIAQSGKWDICKLPWAGSMITEEVGNGFRIMVDERLARL